MFINSFIKRFFCAFGAILFCLISFHLNAQKITQQNASRTNDGQDERLQVNLYFYDTSNNTILADATLARYNNLYTVAVTNEDAGKPVNVDENIAIERDTHLLMVEKRPLIDLNDTIFLKMYNMKLRNYQFQFKPTHFTALYLGAYLQDSYLGTETPLSLDSLTDKNFSVTDVASATPYRFRIVYRPLSILPVNFVDAKAYLKGAGIQVEWSVLTQNNIHHYEVEKSAKKDGFAKVASVNAQSKADASYSWFDTDPYNGNNFYRVKAVEKSGEIIYSKVLNAKFENDKSSIEVYPNPLKNKMLKILFSNTKSGKYTVTFSSDNGQVILKQVISHNGDSTSYSIALDPHLAKGIYHVQVVNDGKKVTRKVMVE